MVIYQYYMLNSWVYFILSDILIVLESLLIRFWLFPDPTLLLSLFPLMFLLPLLFRAFTFFAFFQSYNKHLQVLVAVTMQLAIWMSVGQADAQMLKLQVIVMQSINSDKQLSLLIVLLISYFFNLIYSEGLLQQRLLIIMESLLLFTNILWATLVSFHKNAPLPDSNRSIVEQKHQPLIYCEENSLNNANLSFNCLQYLLLNLKFDIIQSTVKLQEHTKINVIIQDLGETFCSLPIAPLEGSEQTTLRNHFKTCDSNDYRLFKLLNNHLFDFKNTLLVACSQVDAKKERSFLILFLELPPSLIDPGNNLNVIDLCRSLSHELGTNLNGISTFTHLALNDPSVDLIIKEKYFEPISINGEQLHLIVCTIRDYNLMYLNQFLLKIDEIDIRLELRSICALFESALKSKGVKLITETSINSVFFQDRQRFRQILFQLLQNSVKFTLSGMIKLTLECDSSCLECTVSDSGIGVTSDELTKLQSILRSGKFTRVSPNSVGSGIGLCITNQLVRQMNETAQSLTCSQNSSGMSFNFRIQNQIRILNKTTQAGMTKSKSMIKYLSANSYIEGSDQMIKSMTSKRRIPLAEKRECVSLFNNEFSLPPMEDDDYVVQAPPLLVPQMLGGQDHPLRSKCGPKVLIVDDEYFNIQCLQMIMDKLQIRSDAAFNGQQALEKFKSKIQQKQKCNLCQNHSYQLIFLDINMPILDGIATAQEIKALASKHSIETVRCIANTGYCDPDTKMQAFTAGMDVFLTKPIEPKAIMQLVEKYPDI